MQLLMNRHKNRHNSIFPMLASMFGGCSERQLDDLLGMWLHHSQNKSQARGVRGRRWGLEEVWTHLWLLMNRHENIRHGIFPMLASMFDGGCIEQQSDDCWVRGSVCVSQNTSQASGVRGRSLGLEDVWSHLQLLMNKHKNWLGILLMLASMFGGCGEQWLDDSLGAWLCLVKRQVRQAK
jgi:hypothetical protein